MNFLNNLTKVEKRNILIDWINDMDDYGLDEMLVDFLEYEYKEDSQDFDEE